MVAVDLDDPISRPRAFECDYLVRRSGGVSQRRRRLDGRRWVRLSVRTRAELNQSALSAHVQLEWPPGILAGIVQGRKVIRRRNLAEVEHTLGLDACAAAASHELAVAQAARRHGAYHRRDSTGDRLHDGGDPARSAGILILDLTLGRR